MTIFQAGNKQKTFMSIAIQKIVATKRSDKRCQLKVGVFKKVTKYSDSLGINFVAKIVQK